MSLVDPKPETSKHAPLRTAEFADTFRSKSTSGTIEIRVSPFVYSSWGFQTRAPQLEVEDRGAYPLR